MEAIDIKALSPFILKRAEVGILDQQEQEQEQAPFSKKTIIKTELCPDGTHLRIYFDTRYFFAVPLTAEVIHEENQWVALDQQAGLNYVIRKESGLDA